MGKLYSALLIIVSHVPAFAARKVAIFSQVLVTYVGLCN